MKVQHVIKVRKKGYYTMKIGILGVGGISETVAPTLMKLKDIECYAAASRTLSKAQCFAKKYGFEKAYGSYDELLNDPEVELIYVATPHSLHYEHMMQSIAHGKPVLCEKAFTLNAEQAAEIQTESERHQIFAAEAMWTRYMPSRALIQQIIDSGIIGKISTMTANLSYPISQVPRITDPGLAGGALLDVGVYGLNFALMHFGADIERVESSVQFTDTGVDGTESITLFYADGRMAVLTHGIYARSDRKGIFHGDKGYIVVENINNPQSISVFNTKDELIQHYDIPEQISGYEYEFEEAVRCIQEGKRESDSMPLSESIRLMQLADTIRRQWGFLYPQEKEV